MNASDITVKNPLKIAFQKTRNYYNDNKVRVQNMSTFSDKLHRAEDI